MNVPDDRQLLRAMVEGDSIRITNAADGLDADGKTKLLGALLDTFGEERIAEAVASLPSGDRTKVFTGCVQGLVAQKDEAGSRLLNAVKALDEGHAERMLTALGQQDVGRLLDAAAKALYAGNTKVGRDLALETEDVLRRALADRVRGAS